MKCMQSIQQGKAGKTLTVLNGIIIFGFSASLVLIPQAHWWFGLAALVSALLAGGVLVGYKKYPSVLTGNDYKLVSALVLFGSVWWWNVLGSSSIPWVADEGFHHLYLWPFIAAFFLLSARVFTPSPHWLWIGVCCGALGTGLIAIYDRVIIGLARADNGINAIPFGNLSLLLGAISLIVAIYYVQRQRQHYFWLVLLAISAALLGFLASLLSGTRGGWVSIPFIVALLAPATRNLITPKTRNIAILFIVLIIVGTIAYPPTGVWLRLASIFEDAYQYFVNNEANNSLGIRLEMWRAGWIMFIENPILGVGEGSVQKLLPLLVSEEIAYERGIVYPQLHSDIIDTLARRGVVGVISLLFLYIAFALAFTKKMLQDNYQLHSHLLAVSGMMVIVAFFDFGLTQAMLRDLRGFSGFLGFSVAIWACLGYQPQAQS
ncbi:O-antigen ligase family protein [Vreelandella populi]|uniref:O-antigen ligase family protein n=2 Tax=Vreelandella populi TaxID=2498858 RepID=A0A433LF39_9GAMM|nr:O-antigen ligase family protein [Halomonas populi]RUR47741.1 O-antigen ligase family protein [Halomonas populi]